MNDEKKYWLDDPRNRSRVFYALAIVCVLLVVADFLYEKHGHLDYQNWFAIDAAAGFLAYCTIVFSAKALRKVLRRKEDYYEDE